jgi:hypothetical protein
MAGDAPGTMPGGEVSCHEGTGAQAANSYNRWGDYSSMSVDPTDDCTFWYTQEYYEVTGAFDFNTRICSFKIADCGGSPPTPQPPDVNITAPADGSSHVFGEPITFSATAIDPEDGDISNDIVWTRDGGTSLGTGASFVTSSLALGTHTIDATATDNDSMDGSDSITIEIIEAPVSIVMHIGDLDDDSVTAPRNRWEAVVTVTVHDADENPVENATVSGSWSDGANGAGNCVTDANGQCSVSKGNIKSNTNSATYSVSGVSRASDSYDSGANHDPDGDSDGTVITVSQP